MLQKLKGSEAIVAADVLWYINVFICMRREKQNWFLPDN